MTAAHPDFDLVQTGRGPDLLLLHSLLTDRTVFDPIVPRLARAPGDEPDLEPDGVKKPNRPPG